MLKKKRVPNYIKKNFTLKQADIMLRHPEFDWSLIGSGRSGVRGLVKSNKTKLRSQWIRMLELEMETFYKCKFDMLINIKIKDLRGHFYFRKDIKNVIRNYYGAYWRKNRKLKNFSFFMETFYFSFIFFKFKLLLYFIAQLITASRRRQWGKIHWLKELIIEQYLLNHHVMAGIKFVIKGTIKGRNRSVIFTLFQGQMPVQTLDTNIVYHFQKCITQFGVFGIRLWINYRIL